MRRCYRLLVFTALLLCLGTSMLAQATSSLRGKVADAQGGALPGVTVVLANTETAFNRQVVTDEAGSYSLLQVPPGPYTITAELPGFQTASAKIDNGTHSVTFQMNAANYISTIDDDLDFSKVYYQTIHYENLLDTTAGTDFTVTVA